MTNRRSKPGLAVAEIRTVATLKRERNKMGRGGSPHRAGGRHGLGAPARHGLRAPNPAEPWLRPSCPGSPPDLFPGSTRPVGVEDRLGPVFQMQMLGGPGEHGERHGEIIVLPGRTFMNCTALALLGLECHKLLISA